MWAAKVNDKDCNGHICKCHGNIWLLITSLNCLFSGEIIAHPASFSIVLFFCNQQRGKLYMQGQKYTYNHLYCDLTTTGSFFVPT